MKKINLILMSLCIYSFSAHATNLTYVCNSLTEKGVEDSIFSDLTLNINDSKISVDGKFTGIGSVHTEILKSVAIRNTKNPDDKTARYNIESPFKITIYLSKSILIDSPNKTFITFGYADGSNGFVKASGSCRLSK